MAWSLAETAERLRAEDAIGRLSLATADDDLFLELAARAWGDRAAEEAMYQRLLARGRAAATRGTE